MSLQIVQVRNDLLSKLGIEDATLAPVLALQDVVIAMNWAMQTLQTAGQDYFTRERITLTLAAGTAIYNVPTTMQSVLGPVRWNDIKPLRALESQGELDQISRIFLGGAAYGNGANADPEAYWPRYLKTGSIADICGITITIAPAPAAPAGTLVVEAINDAVAYAVADLSSTQVLPVAQNYTESIFLPLARIAVTRSSQFSRPDLLPQLQEDATRAFERLGVSGGFPNVTQPGMPRKVDA